MRSTPTLFDQETIEDKFYEFHFQNPHVYDQLARLSREWMSHGHARLGIATLFEKLRWEWHIAGLKDSEGYKLNNNFRSLYARLLMTQEPDLAGLFEIRQLASERNN